MFFLLFSKTIKSASSENLCLQLPVSFSAYPDNTVIVVVVIIYWQNWNNIASRKTRCCQLQINSNQQAHRSPQYQWLTYKHITAIKKQPLLCILPAITCSKIALIWIIFGRHVAEGCWLMLSLSTLFFYTTWEKWKIYIWPIFAINNCWKNSLFIYLITLHVS